MKKVNKNITLKVFSLIFMLMFVVSLFTSTKVLAEELPFSIKEATITEKSSDATGTITNFNNNEVSSNIKFHKLNDYVTYKLVINSNIDKEITILEIIDNNSNKYIDYQYDKNENKKINSKATFEFSIKCVYENELTDITQRDQINNVKFNIKYLEGGQVKDATITINPKTGDNINVSFILLIVSSVGLIICIVLAKKGKNKKLSKVSTLIITGLILSPIVVQAATTVFSLNLKSNIGIYDKLIVTYVVNGEETTLTNKYGEALTGLATPEKTGFKFTGWTYEDGTKFDQTKPITDDIKISANFKEVLWTIPSGRTPNTLVSGDEICLKYDNTQCFDFIKYDGNDIIMLAKYNLKVGGIYENRHLDKIGEYTSADEGYGKQSSDALGTGANFEIRYGTVTYSKTVYWDDNGTPKNEYPGSYYPGPNYPTIFDPINFNGRPNEDNYSIAYYVEIYKKILTDDYGVELKDMRLLTYMEAIDESIGCDPDAWECPSNGFVIRTSFWLGSADSDYVWYIDTNGYIDEYRINEDDLFGVRPVAVITKSDL